MFLFWKAAVRVHFEHDRRIASVRSEIIRHLERLVEIDKREDQNESEVNVVFCPVVSRAGTDIEAVRSRVKGNKATLVMVLHQTNEQSPIIPFTRENWGEDVVFVDVIFSEDRGLLGGPINTEAFKKAATCLKERGSENDARKAVKKCLRCLVPLGIIIGLLSWSGFFRIFIPFFEDQSKEP